MPFTKGISGNPNGRPHGAKNKSSAEIKNWIGRILSDTDKFEADLADLQPAERIRVYMTLLQYYVPRISAYDPTRYIEAEKQALWDMMVEMPDRALEILAKKLKKLEKQQWK